MNAPTQAYPLTWPAGWKRATSRQRSRFGKWNARPTIAKGVEEVTHELELMKARDIIISSDLVLRNDGLPRSGQPNPKDPGVAVYFTRNGQKQVLACDTYDLPGCNLYAISMTVNALRGIARWGASELLDRAFTGFKALPQEASRASWWRVLDVHPDCNYAQVKASWRALVTRYHPDNNAFGDRDKFQQVQDAWADAQKHFGKA